MKKKNLPETLKNIKPEKGDWAVISGGDDFKYALVCFKNEKEFFWGQGFGYCIMLKKFKIVEFIGKVKQKDWDKIEMEYLEKYYPLKSSKPKESAGWISPKGDFYSCKPEEHRGLAKRLSAKFYADIDNPERTLELSLWIKVYSSGVLGWRHDYYESLEEVITQSQIDFLYDLSEVSTGEYQKNIKERLHYITSNKNV